MSHSIAEAERELFAEALTCSEDLPAEFVAQALDGPAAERAIDRSEALFRAIAQIEEGGGEEGDERGGHEQSLHRIEAKLNVLLDLVGALVRRDMPTLPLRSVRWSRRGLALPQEAATAPGTLGLLRLQPASWLPQTVELPVEVIACGNESGQNWLWLRLAPRPSSFESAVERHLFRLHRRAIAGARRQR